MFDRLFDFNLGCLRVFIGELPRLFYREKIPLRCEVAVTADEVPFEKRSALAYRPIVPGEMWGENWESSWFHVMGMIPRHWDKRSVKLLFNAGGEGLIFAPDGTPAASLTGGSVYSASFVKNDYLLPEDFTKKGVVDLWIEGAANTLFGLLFDGDPELRREHPQGRFTGILQECAIGLFDEEVWQLSIDLKVIEELISGLPEKDYRRRRHLKTCKEAMATFRTSGAAAARQVLREIFDITPSGALMTVHGVGHAHIDTGWLWPVRETVRKCARTFAAQLDLIERYPGYIFGASSPQHYAFIKKRYPALYRKIKAAVKAGRWELQGGMWVEADANIISGESMVRQFLHGKNFFMDEFGIEVKNLWLPDVFGYSASMPQIIKRSGCDHFLTQKISWSQFNTFPCKTFNWKGIDGSVVLTHFPPENSYNSQLKTDRQLKAQSEYPEGYIVPDYMSLFGIGDGGGGPYPELVERGKRLAHLDGAPRFKFDTAENFFREIARYKDELPVWQGELYLELHRGTLTTQSRIKKLNRRNEQLLTETEFICSMLPLEEYPAKELDRLWKLLLLNQFHDIIPGSSIHMVYEQTEKEHHEISSSAEKLIAAAAKKLFPKEAGSAVVVNSLSYPCETLVELPAEWSGSDVTDGAGNVLPCQPNGGGLLVRVKLAPSSVTRLLRATSRKAKKSAPSKLRKLVLENELCSYRFAPDGKLIAAFDKRIGRNVIPAGEQGNRLALYDDKPLSYDAWDIDCTYLEQTPLAPEAVAAEWVESGPLRQTIRFELAFPCAQIVQLVSLESGKARLDFKTEVRWHGEHQMLRTSFPVDVFAQEAAFDIQYGFLKRPTHKNTSWDFARFECCGQRYADISNTDYGVALLNDCKYGFHVHGNVLDLNLLRSPKYPDHLADQGEQSFTYSLLPHLGALPVSEVFAEAALLNRAPRVICGAGAGALPFCRLESSGITLEVVKKAEKESCLILRLVENRGETSSGVLRFAAPATAAETSLLEWEEKPLAKSKALRELPVTLGPFEIRTLKVRPAK